ncbi:NADH-quinone oxidoreductase subunit L [Buchnera aphidicola]|uniref:NADH-quinone oxidoreductase subunit L n=1 Tax=Buchnera aphidicola TaxID=9 RepID=UPI003464C8D1
MNIIYLIILFPILSFLVLQFLHRIFSYRFIIFTGITSILLSTIIAIFLLLYFIHNKLFIIKQKLWLWFILEKYEVNFSLLLDDLSLTFVIMILCIGFLVSIFSIWYMKKKKIAIFFALINFFIANMLILVLSDNFITMYIGWEGVSICSYFLINFYYYSNIVNKSAMQSFIITKIGDLFFISAILTIYFYYHTLNFYDIQFFIKIHLIKYTTILNVITILLLFGAIGKSAQIPLHIWLPKAMVGPTPVSALIHAATMVTAGVYLILRNHDLFIMTPKILNLSGILGSITVLISSIAALFQVDIKKILAYSTMSQIGYMFMALSVGAWYAAVVHLVTHAIFKALLFLSAGALIIQCKNEKNIFYMGNQLWREFPFLYFCFLVGGSSLSSIPILTSGFYSKGSILFYIFKSQNIFFFTIAMLSTCLTTIYIYRLIFIVFHTQSNIIVKKFRFSFLQWCPLIILLVLSTFLGRFCILNISNFFPTPVRVHYFEKLYLECCSSFFIMLSFGISYFLYFTKINIFSKIFKNIFVSVLLNFFVHGFYIFKIYKFIFITPFTKITKYIFYNASNVFLNTLVSIFIVCNKYILSIENGFLSSYMTIILFSIFFITLLIIY